MAKGLAIVPSSKLRRPGIRKGLGGAEQKKKLKSLRSIKLASLDGSSSRRESSSTYDQPSSPPKETDVPPNYLKMTKSSDVRMLSSQSSPRKSKSSINGIDQSEIFNSFKPNGARNIPIIAFRRTSTLRPVRILAKVPSLRPKRPAARKCSEISDVSDSSIHRATCSSAIKDSKFHANVENQQEGGVSEEIPAMKACTYSYCSLHGHRHAAPTLKRLKSARRHVKSQRSKRLDALVHREGKVLGRKSSHEAEKELTEETSSRKVMGLNADVKGERVDEVAEVALQEKQQQSEMAASLVADEESICKASDSYLEDQHGLEPSPTSQEAHIKQESEEEIVECIYVEKNVNDKSEGSRSSEKAKFVSVGVQTELELEELENELSAADYIVNDPYEEASEAAVAFQENEDEKRPLTGDLSHEHSSSHYEQLNSSKTVDIDQEKEHARAIGTEGLASVHEKMEENLESPGEPTDALPDLREEPILVCEKIDENQEALGETTEAFSGSLEEANLPCKNVDEDLESLGEPEVNSTSNDPYKSSFGRQKFNGLWYLIYQHMVSDVAENGGMESSVERDSKEEQVINAKLSPEFGQDPKGANDDEATQQERLQQSDAIKLLQEAISEILEQSQDQCSIRKSAGNNVNFDKKEMVEDHFTDRQSEKDLEVKEEMLEAHLVPKAEEQRGVNAGGRPNQLASKRWSNLKKYILMKRFIKAMEKTKNFGCRIQRYPSSEVSPEHEKVNLRRQPIGEKKNAEEWMLDHALQKAVSNLDPAQKRRVALLVEAFERVNPIPEGKTRQRMNASSPSTVSPLASRKTSLVQTEKQAATENVSYHKLRIGQMPSLLDKFTNVREKLCDPSKDCDGDRKDSETFVESPILRMQVPEDYVELAKVEVSTSSSQVHNELKVPTTANNAPDGDVKSMPVKELTKAVEEVGEAVVENEEILGSYLPEQCRPISVTDIGEELQLERKKYSGLWYLIYKHMASGLAAEQGNEPTDSLVDGSKKEEEEEPENEEDKKKSRSTDTDGPGSLKSEENMLMAQTVDSEEMKLRKIEAVKLVQQAIDDILREREDGSPHNHHRTGNSVPEQESKEKSCTSCGETSLPSSTDSTKDSYMCFGRVKEHKPKLDPEMQIRSDDAARQEEERTAFRGANKSKPRPVKNWSNLRKVILLKRFVKALETKVSNFNPREQRHLHLDPDVEHEKVNLKHQDMDERKSAEEYLLDYALQQVVSRLTPARKRKVHSLVEAFETITPPLSK